MDIILQSPLDMHLHLREGEMLQKVASHSSNSFAGAVIMPNLLSPVDSLEKMTSYREAITSCCEGQIFRPYMTLFFRNYGRAELEAIKDEIIGIKLYPAGITTRSDSGVTDFSTIGKTLTLMEELKIPLLVHGESGGFVMDREKEFLKVYQQMAVNFPQLHIIMEHITTAEAVEFLDRYANVSATVTLHHLLITLDDVAGGLLQPDLFCKPIAKTPKDKEALREAVLSGHKQIMFGSDSAPHPRHKKECCGCAAGIFSAPVALPMLAEFFADAGRVDLFQGFISDIAIERYQLKPPVKRICLREENWLVPEVYADIRPFFAGKELSWKLVGQ
jgi:dihydroorotase